jgi:hypothetical protein
MSLTREAILACTDVQIKPVRVEAWGGDVYVRSLTGAERDKWESSNVIRDRKSGTYDVKIENLRARLVTLSVCDDKGVRLFTDADVKEIGQKNAAVLAQLYDVAAKLSGITKEDLDDIAKNSSADPNDGSTSA